MKTPILVCLRLGLVAAASMSPLQANSLLEVFPASPMTNAASGYTFTNTYSSSTSAWAIAWPESSVFHARLRHEQVGVAHRTWNLRIGKGGQIYSLRSSYGELIPPQWRATSPEPQYSPWNDDVFEPVAVNTVLNNNPNPYFIHGAGPYIEDTLTSPWYSPMVTSGARDSVVEPNAYVAVNWGQHAHLPTTYRSGLIYYTQYKDVDAGIIEVTQYVYNFGPDLANWLNLPWGGVRRTTARYLFLTDTAGVASGTPVPETALWANGLFKDFDQTGGWVRYSQGSGAGHFGLGFVFGKDKATFPSWQYGKSRYRYGYAESYPASGATETNWRNFTVGTTIRMCNLPSGSSMWSRYYLVTGSVANINTLIANNALVSKASYGGPLLYTEDTTGTNPNVLIPYYEMMVGTRKVLGGIANGPVVLWAYAKPVLNSRPLFRVVKTDGTHYATCDPYTLSGPGGVPGPYAGGVLRPYDGNTAVWRLLGYVLPAGQTNQQGQTHTYGSLASVLSQFGANNGASGDYYRGNGLDMKARIP